MEILLVLGLVALIILGLTARSEGSQTADAARAAAEAQKEAARKASEATDHGISCLAVILLMLMIGFLLLVVAGIVASPI